MLDRGESLETSPDEVVIFKGPRNKSLATQHLEYIAYALLNNPKQVNAFKLNDKNLMVVINNHTFNLSKILAAKPDFEQLYFTHQQLDLYLTLNDTSHINWFSFENALNLHPAEQNAISLWTSISYVNMQNLLRNKPYEDEWIKTLLDICIASHGLAKPLSNIRHCPQELVRGEDYSQSKKRKCPVGKSILFQEKGFTATSKSSWNGYTLTRSVKINFKQQKSINPIGKPISQYSYFWVEREVLFPPNSEFIYTHCEDGWFSDKWKAIPVRSINTTYVYDHNLTPETLNQLNKEKFNFLLSSVYQILVAERKKHNYPRIKKLFFDTTANDIGTECLENSINVIKKLLSNFRNCHSNEEYSLLKYSFDAAIAEIEYVLYENQEILKTESSIYQCLQKATVTLEELKNSFPEVAIKCESPQFSKYK